MIEQVLELFAVYGMPAVFVIMAAGQFGAPLPTSILLLTVGALLVEGDIAGWQAFLWVFTGAVLGDQLGYAVGRFGGERLRTYVAGRKSMTAGLEKAEAYSAKWGGLGVFLTRWLFCPLGPMVNFVSGLTRMRWPVFIAADLAGEVIWVGLYLSLGYLFSSSISTIASIVANAAWLLAALAITLLLGWRVARVARKQAARSTG